MKNDNKDDHVCVVNAGLHYQAKMKYPDIPEDRYVNNVQSYLCSNLFVETEVQEVNPTVNPTVNLQRSSVSLKWNQGVYSMIASTFPENSFIINVWNESVCCCVQR